MTFTDALLDRLSLFVSQMRVAARSVADPAMFVRRHGSIMHPWRQSDFPCPGVGPLLNVAYLRETGRRWGQSCENFTMIVQASTPNDAVDCAPVRCGGDPRKTAPTNCNSSSKDFNCLVIARVLRTRILLMSVSRRAQYPTGKLCRG